RRGGRYPSGKDCEPAVVREDARVSVVQRDVLRAAADVRRVDLELHEEPEEVPLRDVSEREEEVAVTARLAHRRRLDGVHRLALAPTRRQEERRALQVVVRADRET